MKKFIIQNIPITINDKEKINIILLESSKDEKYVLYSENSIDENNINTDIFIKFEFNENISILPKKKLNEMNLKIHNTNNLYTLLWNNNKVYYLKNYKNIKLNDPILKLILSDGLLYNKLNKNDNNLVDNILQKNKKLNDEIDTPLKFLVKKENTVESVILESKEEPIITPVILESKEEPIVTPVILESKEEPIVKSVILESKEEPIVKSVILESKPEKPFEKLDNTVKNINFNTINNIEIKKIEKIDTKPVIDTTTNRIETIKNIGNIINQEKIDLDNKKIELENNSFNLENLLTDFNKLFQSVYENKIQDNSVINNKNTINEINTNTVSTVNSNNTYAVNEINTKTVNEINTKTVNEINTKTVITNTVNTNIQNNIQKNTQKQYISKIIYSNVLYKVNTIKLEKSNELNFLNLYQTKIVENNIVNNSNISFELDNNNSSYLINYFHQKYLINKINNSIILTNIIYKKTQLIKNKENFKLGMFDYMLYNNGNIIIPMINKKIYDNNYGTAFNMYIPKV